MSDKARPLLPHGSYVSCFIFIARGLDILVVRVALQLFQVLVVGAKGQPELDIRLAGDLERAGKRVQALPEDPPAYTIMQRVFFIQTKNFYVLFFYT